MRNSIASIPYFIYENMANIDYTSILNKYFGYSSFRGIQKDIVESIGAGHDTLGLMPTGGGKSITFQVPALAQIGVCLVVTPLIALMKDQVEHLRNKGILASAIYTGMSRMEINQVLDNAIYGGVKFLYVSPERLSSSAFVDKLRYMKVCFIAVDEAHCISQWGYDFRPSYLHIAKIREILPDVPVLALTATATPAVVDDIMDKLHFKEKQVFRMSFERGNLVYVVRKSDSKMEELLHILRSFPGSAIVYARSRKGVTEISDYLNENGVMATFYHAGLGTVDKDNRQHEWMEGGVRVMVATNAFGMGIDKSDVRLVVHMDCPESLEAYFQEAGRGGRDGKRSYAVLLYNASDRRKLLKHVISAFPEKKYIRKVYDDLAYFFQLAIDDGIGARYEFDIERFCRVFHHYPDRLIGALNVLQRAEYLQFQIDSDTKTRCKILVARDDLYTVKGLSHIDDQVLTTLMRTYSGLFSDYVFIDEMFIAETLFLSKATVKEALKSLSHRHILQYIPGRRVPVVYYTHHRVESDKLIIAADVYDVLMDRMKERVDAMLEYSEGNDVCRSTALLKYFGEDTDDCGACDVCQERKRQMMDAENHTEQLESNVSSAQENSLFVKQDGETVLLKVPDYLTPYYNILIGEFAKMDNIIPISDMMKMQIPRDKLDALIELLRDKGALIIEKTKLRLINAVSENK